MTIVCRQQVFRILSCAFPRCGPHPSASSHVSICRLGRCFTTRVLRGIHSSVISALDNTPVIQLQHIAPRGVNVYVKCEAFNPMISMKDRLSVGLLEWAEIHGHLRTGQMVVDSFDGNAGVGLAMACTQRGYPLVLVLPESSSVEWRRWLRFLGAKVLVAESPGIVAKHVTEELAAFPARQFQAEANSWIHEHKTGPEILAALDGKSLDYFVAPHGTGGMLKGVGKVLRARSPKTKICVVEQDSRPHPDYEVMYGPHPNWPEELLKGWTTDFAPKPIEESLRHNYVDDMVRVGGEESMMVARALAQIECIFTGISGSTLAAGALRLARQVPIGSSVLTVLLDTSHFHFTTPLLTGVGADMNDEELQLLESAQKRLNVARREESGALMDGHF